MSQLGSIKADQSKYTDIHSSHSNNNVNSVDYNVMPCYS